MPATINFYMDDSGARHPDHKPGKQAIHGRDWFALGGVLIKSEDESASRASYERFCSTWKLSSALHSVDIRSRNAGFLWLQQLPEMERLRFYEELYQFMRQMPVVGLACVIDRPGYNARYSGVYGRNRWLLCRTAFCVAIERAAKYARSLERQLRVMPERCNKPEDARLADYYAELRASGMPFESRTSEKYVPLLPQQFRETLYEFRLKRKSSPLAQVADLYLWPICMGGYHASNRTYARLKADGKLIECLLNEADWPNLASKYSCFESVVRTP